MDNHCSLTLTWALMLSLAMILHSLLYKNIPGITQSLIEIFKTN